MTLPEFKKLMMASTTANALAGANTRGKRRHGHAPVSTSQQAESPRI